MPPSEGPMTVSRRSIPSERAVSKPARAMSSTDRSGKAQPVGLARGRVGRGGPGRAEAASQGIDADDEKAVGIEREPGPHHPLPPAFGGVSGRRGCVRGRGEAREKQQRVVARGVELAPGLVGDTRAVQRASAPHGEGIWQRCVLTRIHGATYSIRARGRCPRGCLRRGASTGSARRCRVASRGSPSPWVPRPPP